MPGIKKRKSCFKIVCTTCKVLGFGMRSVDKQLLLIAETLEPEARDTGHRLQHVAVFCWSACYFVTSRPYQKIMLLVTGKVISFVVSIGPMGLSPFLSPPFQWGPLTYHPFFQIDCLCPPVLGPSRHIYFQRRLITSSEQSGNCSSGNVSRLLEKTSNTIECPRIHSFRLDHSNW